MARLEDIVARGGDKNVEVSKDDPDVVRATFRHANYQSVYGTFLRGKLSNVLFPENVPKPLQFGKDGTGRYYMDVERVPLDARHLRRQIEINGSSMSSLNKDILRAEQNNHELDFYDHITNNQYPRVDDVLRKFANAGLPLDDDLRNLSLAGGLVRNVDLRSPWVNGIRTFNPEKIRAHIETLDGPKKEQAAQILKQLLDLEKASDI